MTNIEKSGCFGCKHSEWDADGATCALTGLLVGNYGKDCKKRVADEQTNSTELHKVSSRPEPRPVQLPDSVQNILAYGQGYNDGMKDGHICGFHDSLVCSVHDLTALLKKYAELENEYAGLQEKARRERIENMSQFGADRREKRGRWIPCGGDTAYTKYYRCSLCGYEISGYAENDDLIKYNYCPHCGANTTDEIAMRRAAEDDYAEF
jgi:DNA-directed RNA polymerase subunit RPC12/RpoP